ncbi:hypothetical protein ACJX0J_020614, partial [Zea mays]
LAFKTVMHGTFITRLEFINKLRYLDCQSKETSTSRYPFPLAKKNRHDERKAYHSISRDEAVQGYALLKKYPDIDENEEDLVQKMIWNHHFHKKHALAFFYSFLFALSLKRMDRSASLGIRHQNYKTGVVNPLGILSPYLKQAFIGHVTLYSALK